MSNNPIDLKVYKELQDTIGHEFVVELVTTFFEEVPNMLSELRTALADGNAELFRLASHSLRSNAQIFGASTLADQSHALELRGLDVDQIENEASLDVLEATYERARDALIVLTNE